jgi:hypothetical protein
MQRIATATKAVDLYGVGKHGFKDGNLGLGIVPTDMDAAWCNGLQEEVVNCIETAGLVATGATLTQLRDAIAIAVRLQSAAYASAGGTADALTGIYAPVVPALVNGLTLYVRAALANATTTPTFAPNGLAAKTIVKGNGLALVAGDIAGAGHWVELQYDLTLDKWVLLNPATGVNLLPLFASVKAASGYQKLPGGLILQWGSGSAYTAAIDATFPITFPTACISIATSVGTATSDLDASGTYRGDQTFVNMAIPTNVGFKAQMILANNPANSRNYRYLAVGY